MSNRELPTQEVKRVETRVLVATTAMLAFISFWRAAAIVLNDMGSSAFYAGAIAEHFIGKTGPWFILAIMCLAYAVRSIYIESCSMFVRGGVYRVVKEAMGSTLAKFSVSALMFDYILTGPISGVSAGLYLVGLLNELLRYAHVNFVLPVNLTAALFAILVTIYFWRENIKGISESSEKALRIMYVTTVIVVIMIVWCAYTLWVRGIHLPPWPSPTNLTFSGDALGWLRHTNLPYTIGLIGILIGLGHSVLAMSGEETMAQVYREIEHPKLRNLEKAGFVIFVYSLIFTAGVAFAAVMIIPDQVRQSFSDNPIGGLAMYLVGPLSLRLAFRAFVVIVGTLMLAGAVNTAIVGSNGVLNRVSEDGILPQWFRQPHRRFGTSYRILNLVVGLQIATIVLSRGNIFVLGEAYAFGVMWSFAMKGLAVLMLRYKQPGKREFRVPLNLKIGNLEIPLGLGLITRDALRALRHQSLHEASRHGIWRGVHADLIRYFYHRRTGHGKARSTRRRTRSIQPRAPRTPRPRGGRRSSGEHSGHGSRLHYDVWPRGGAASCGYAETGRRSTAPCEFCRALRLASTISIQSSFSVSRNRNCARAPSIWRKRMERPSTSPSPQPPRNGTASCVPRKPCSRRRSFSDSPLRDQWPKKRAWQGWPGRPCRSPSRG